MHLVGFIIIIDYGLFKDDVRGLLCVESYGRVISPNDWKESSTNCSLLNLKYLPGICRRIQENHK